MRIPAAALVALLALPLGAQQHPRDNEIHDADTLAWWHTTEYLSGDAMQGRDTGTVAYQNAALYVTARFMAAGLKPAGERSGYFQVVPMHQVDVTPEGTSFDVTHPGDHLNLSYEFLQRITINASEDLPAALAGPMTFRGYCGKEAMADISGKVVFCFGTQRQGLPGGGERLANARAGHAAALVNVDDPYFTIEPPRWPFAYARSVTLRAPEAHPHTGDPMPVMRISAFGFTELLYGSGHKASELLELGGAKKPLPSFDVPGTFTLHTHVEEKDISSPNVLAVLPGSDPVLKDEYVVVGAHLDGYGFGTPVNGDGLYNGTLDDAAYVALLIQLADDIKSGKLPRPKRSILFAAFTGEEKGLLGSNWFVKHPTAPLAQIVADVNLDQLRPLFPLKILTAEALGDSTLGDTARSVGKPMGIEIRPDMEPERGLLRRADQFPFLQAHVPAISFIFGYDPGTEAERRYREWYQVRYHRPQDDLTQPVDFDAAAKFDTFFYTLVEAVANAPEKPAFAAGSAFAGKQKP